MATKATSYRVADETRLELQHMARAWGMTVTTALAVIVGRAWETFNRDEDDDWLQLVAQVDAWRHGVGGDLPAGFDNAASGSSAVGCRIDVE